MSDDTPPDANQILEHRFNVCMQELQTKQGQPHLDALRRQVTDSPRYQKTLEENPGLDPEMFIRRAIKLAIIKDPEIVRSRYHEVADEVGLMLYKMGFSGAHHRDELPQPKWAEGHGQRKSDREVG